MKFDYTIFTSKNLSHWIQVKMNDSLMSIKLSQTTPLEFLIGMGNHREETASLQYVRRTEYFSSSNKITLKNNVSAYISYSFFTPFFELVIFFDLILDVNHRIFCDWAQFIFSISIDYFRCFILSVLFFCFSFISFMVFFFIWIQIKIPMFWGWPKPKWMVAVHDVLWLQLDFFAVCGFSLTLCVKCYLSHVNHLTNHQKKSQKIHS